MRELFERLRVPLLLGVLATLSLVVVASDRRAMTSGAHQHGFLPSVLIEVAAPVQKLLSLPAELTRSGWGRYVALQGVRGAVRQIQVSLMRFHFPPPHAGELSAKLTEGAGARGRRTHPLRLATLATSPVSGGGK